MRYITIGEFLTNDEILQCSKCTTAEEIEKEVIAPNIDRINKALGQENNARYLAYAVEYVLSCVERDKGLLQVMV